MLKTGRLIEILLGVLITQLAQATVGPSVFLTQPAQISGVAQSERLALSAQAQPISCRNIYFKSISIITSSSSSPSTSTYSPTQPLLPLIPLSPSPSPSSMTQQISNHEIEKLINQIDQVSLRIGKQIRDQKRAQILNQIDQILADESTTALQIQELAWQILTKRRPVLSLRNNNINYKIAMAYYKKLESWQLQMPTPTPTQMQAQAQTSTTTQTSTPNNKFGLQNWTELVRVSGLYRQPRFMNLFKQERFPNFIDSIELVLKTSIANGEKFRPDDENMDVVIQMLKVHMESLKNSLYSDSKSNSQNVILRAQQFTQGLLRLMDIDELRQHLYFKTLVYNVILFLKKDISTVGLSFKKATEFAALIYQLEYELNRP